ncbi:MAG TPA: hypothetical protein DCX92_12515, partial [Bacteroidetes bacterium]|nr:hypothetical protein [Bacteroidota bacterium]
VSTSQNPENVRYNLQGTYPVTLIASNSFGSDTLVRTCYITVIPWMSVQQTGNEIPSEFSLSQNYPNPFNPATKIRFQIPASVETTRRVVSLRIYDISGKEISTLVNGELRPGVYEADWDASAYSSGIYFYTLTSGDFKETKKMMLIK